MVSAGVDKAATGAGLGGSRPGRASGSSRLGSTHARKGNASRLTAVSVNSRWRATALERRRKRPRPSATDRTTVQRSVSATSQPKASISSPLSLGVVDQLLETPPLAIGEAGVFHLDEGRHRAVCRPPEERVEQVAEGRPAGGLGRQRGKVDVTRTVVLVPQPALPDQDPERGSDRRIGRGLGHLRADLCGRGPAEPVDDVHHLALAPAEPLVVPCHDADYGSLVLKKQHCAEKSAEADVARPATGRTAIRVLVPYIEEGLVRSSPLRVAPRSGGANASVCSKVETPDLRGSSLTSTTLPRPGVEDQCVLSIAR